MFFSSLKFSHCQVTSQEAPWIEKPSGSSVLPGQNELTVILFYIAQANKLFSIYLASTV